MNTVAFHIADVTERAGVELRGVPEQQADGEGEPTTAGPTCDNDGQSAELAHRDRLHLVRISRVLITHIKRAQNYQHFNSPGAIYMGMQRKKRNSQRSWAAHCECV